MTDIDKLSQEIKELSVRTKFLLARMEAVEKYLSELHDRRVKPLSKFAEDDWELGKLIGEVRK